MFKQKRHAKRQTADLPVELVLYNSENDSILAGPTPSFMHDINYYGTCLLLKKVFFPPHHLFYTPRDNETHILCLEKKSPPAERDIIVPIKPVWFRIDEVSANDPYFRMGVEFMTDPEDVDIIELEKVALASFNSDEDILTKLINIFH